MSKRNGEANGDAAVCPAKRVAPQLGEPINVEKWVEESKKSFLPPVCNKLMYGAGQLKVMFVGGPNSRKDYHIDEGEEFFYMLKGDMCLKIIEKGKPKDVIIKEGEVFRLPSRVQHSPQRLQNTVGLVIERERLPEESDGLRYFCEDGTTVLWEKWFHCEDLGTQLGPIIKEYFASDEHKTGKPDPEKISKDPPVKVDHVTEVHEPFLLQQWIEDNRDEISKGSKDLFSTGEFKITLHGAGEQAGDWQGETWLWQQEGTASLTVGEVTRELVKDDVIIVPAGAKYLVQRPAGSIGMSVIMDPLASK